MAGREERSGPRDGVWDASQEAVWVEWSPTLCTLPGLTPLTETGG